MLTACIVNAVFGLIYSSVCTWIIVSVWSDSVYFSALTIQAKRYEIACEISR